MSDLNDEIALTNFLQMVTRVAPFQLNNFHRLIRDGKREKVATRKILEHALGVLYYGLTKSHWDF